MITYVRNVVGSASITALCIRNIFSVVHVWVALLNRADQSALFTKSGGPPVLTLSGYCLNKMHTCMFMLFLVRPGTPLLGGPCLRPVRVRTSKNLKVSIVMDHFTLKASSAKDE